MAQYLSPGVYVEEIPGPQTIEGVSTSTAGFVGLARMGPISGTPSVLTCVSDYVATYGSLDKLTLIDYAGNPVTIVNYLGQSVREFFDNGGSLLYVSRIYQAGSNVLELLWPGGSPVPYGYASALQTATGSPPSSQTITWTGRYPGSGGNVMLLITLSISPNVLTQIPATSTSPMTNTLRGTLPYDVVWVSPTPSGSPPAAPGTGGQFYWAESYLNTTTGSTSWRFHGIADTAAGSGTDISLWPMGTQIFVLRASVQITYPDSSTRTDVYGGISFDPRSNQSFAEQFGPNLANGQQQLVVPMVFTFSDTGPSAGIEIVEIMLGQTGVSVPQLIGGTPAQFTVLLEGGLDGYWPMAADYQGSEDPSNPQSKTGLKALEDVTEVSVVAAPGSTYMAGGDPTQEIYQQALAAQFYLITHCEIMAYRIAVLDSPDNYSVSQVSAWRGQIDSSYAALYYPWVQIADPTANATSTNTEITLPGCGFVAGIYARNDAENGAQKAPANEVVTDALGFELMLNKGQQDILNPLGVNCFRYFPNRGYRLWGARTATSDTEWQYVNLRRYMNYLKASIDQGTQYVVFENNGQETWANVEQIATDFLYSEFVKGALFGSTQAQAFFVRCDQTTMTQNDIDNGRLVCLIGVALLRPAEFVIFRIGQFTASSSGS